MKLIIIIGGFHTRVKHTTMTAIGEKLHKEERLAHAMYNPTIHGLVRFAAYGTVFDQDGSLQSILVGI